MSEGGGDDEGNGVEDDSTGNDEPAVTFLAHRHVDNGALDRRRAAPKDTLHLPAERVSCIEVGVEFVGQDGSQGR